MNYFKELESWRKERGLDQVEGDPIVIIKHMIIELTESLEAYHNGDMDGVADGILDAQVYGINGLEQWGFNAEKGMSEVLKEIHSRKGWYDVKEQKFQKKITGNEYKADFSECWHK